MCSTMYTNLKGKKCRTIQILGQNVYDSTTLGKKCVGLYKHKDKNVQKVTNIRTKMCRTIQNLVHKICVGLYKHSDKKCVRLCTVCMYIHAYRGADAELVVEFYPIDLCAK